MEKSEKNLKKYQIVKQEILAKIQNGQLKPNEQITTETELASEFGISRQTVRQAIGEMVAEGILYRVQGRGTFVSKNERHYAVDSRNIAVMTTSLFSYIYPHIVRGAEEVLSKNNYGLLLASTEHKVEKEKECMESFLNKQIEGLIVEPTLSALPNPNYNYYLALEARGIPYVMTNSYYPQLGGPCLLLDDEKVSHMAVEHLRKLGHERIAGIFHFESLQGVRRMRGFIEALRCYGLPMDGDLIGHFGAMDKEEKVDQFIKSLVNRPDAQRPTALVCYNDEIAIMALASLRRLGLQVPDDMSVTGVDDSFFFAPTDMKLTTISHPKEDMGKRAAELLLEMIEKETTTAEDIIFEPELIVRESTGKARCRVSSC